MGEGGFGDVFKAERLADTKVYAAKFLKNEITENDIEECLLMAKAQSIFILGCIDYFINTDVTTKS